MPLPPDAQQRLDALRRFLVVDAPEEDELDRLVRVAASVYGVSHAVLTLREGDAERVAYVYGASVDVFGGDRVLMDLPAGPRLPFAVPDASTDARFKRNPLVHGPVGAKFVASVPLKSVHDFTMGTLAILDPESQEMNGEGLALLVDLGALVEPALNLRQVASERDETRTALDAATADRNAAAAALVSETAAREAAAAERDRLRQERDTLAAEAASSGPWIALLDIAPAPLTVVGPEGAILYANAAARLLLGLGEAVSGGHLADHVDAASEPPMAALLMDPGAVAEVTLTDGRAFQLTATAADAVGAGAVIIAFREAAADDGLIDELHAHEEALRVAAAEIHAKEAALAAAANALALRDAEADHALTRRLALYEDRVSLNAAVHHELRSALNGVLGYAEMLAEDDSEDEPQREIGRTMIAASERVLRLLGGSLQLVRLDTDWPPLEVVEVGPLVERAVEPFRSRADAHDLALYAEIPSAPLYALTDAGAVIGVLEALLSNALEHTERGGIRVRLAAADGHLNVEIRDTGAGMDENALEHILTAAPRGIERRTGGHGVGLALARRLAERMDAQILATSAPGQGSVFCLRLPASPSPLLFDLPGGDGAMMEVTEE